MTAFEHHQVVIIVGGGTAGISVAARLTKGWFNKLDVAVIEPSDKHYYQPLWTLVGGGVFDKGNFKGDRSLATQQQIVSEIEIEQRLVAAKATTSGSG